jgi:hypothetical protein
MKIELTIKADYLPGWGVYEGLRELLQNGKDAETEHAAALTVRYRAESGTIVIENDGCVLPHEALLLGHTSKTDRPDMIGKFGEGLKLGILALVRANMPVKIRSGSEVWVPSIQRSEKFNANVLTFDVSKGREFKNRVAVEIGRLAPSAWDEIKDRFLFLGTVRREEKVSTAKGNLLLASRFKGKVYVKGIFVCNDPRLSFGYDFVDADVDRDRRMISKYDLNYAASSLWREALGTRPDLVTSFGSLLVDNAADVEGFDDWNAGYLPDDTLSSIAKQFTDLHGPDAIAVSSLSESADIEHLGKKGVVCPKPLRVILEKRLGSATSNKEKLREEVVRTYGWHDLDASERDNLSLAIALIQPHEAVTLDDLDVVDFRDDNIRGMHKDNRELLAKKILSDRSMTLRVLVHEVAHRAGGDGEKSHVANIERIWASIVSSLQP